MNVALDYAVGCYHYTKNQRNVDVFAVFAEGKRAAAYAKQLNDDNLGGGQIYFVCASPFANPVIGFVNQQEGTLEKILWGTNSITLYENAWVYNCKTDKDELLSDYKSKQEVFKDIMDFINR